MQTLRQMAAILTLALFVISTSVTFAALPKTIDAYVIKTVDGDTLQLKVNGKTERVRMIGVDTPETHHPKKPVQHYGPEAEQFTRDHLQGKTVYFELDVRERDRYGRIIAYVWTSKPKNDSDGEIRDKMFKAACCLKAMLA